MYALLTYCHTQLRQTDQARAACEQGLRLFPEDVELRFRRALLLHEAGRLDESAVAYMSILNGDGERYFASVDRGIRGFKARQNLALVYADMGDLVRSEEQWRLVVQEAPRYRAGWRGWGEALLRQGKREEARSLTDRMLPAEHLRGDGLVLQGWIAAADGDVAESKRLFREAAALRPNDPEALEAALSIPVRERRTGGGRSGDWGSAALTAARRGGPPQLGYRVRPTGANGGRGRGL